MLKKFQRRGAQKTGQDAAYTLKKTPPPPPVVKYEYLDMFVINDRSPQPSVISHCTQVAICNIDMDM